MANIITFSAHEEFVKSSITDKPVPIKVNIPEWYKKIKHTRENPTVKGCVPFLETLTTGYLLKVPQDMEYNFGTFDDKGIPSMAFKNSLPDGAAKPLYNLNQGGEGQAHPPRQLEGSPAVGKQHNRPFLKILNPWRIKTPPGYSCLFVPPLNNHDYPWSIIPGIVDTDTFNQEINFPCVVDVDKIKNKDKTFIIEKGTPYVQIIPFKKESWKMNIEKDKKSTMLLWPLKLLHSYKNLIWNKISWN